MTDTDIVFHGTVAYVARTRTGYEIRVHAGTHSVTVGHSPDAHKAIRTAKGMERYPAQARAFAGL